MKRPAWVARRIATAKALRELPLCELCGIKKGMGYIADSSPDGPWWNWACSSCAAEARRAQREKRP